MLRKFKVFWVLIFEVIPTYKYISGNCAYTVLYTLMYNLMVFNNFILVLQNISSHLTLIE